MMAELVDSYRNLLWGAVMVMITGGYLFTGLGLVYLYNGINVQAARMLMLDREMREIKERQIKALAEAEMIHKSLYTDIENLKQRKK